jgi:3-dehydroquinate dehydratase type I
MICVAISDKNSNKCLEILDKVEMAEIRLDLTGFDLDEIEKVFSHPTLTIATCRAEHTGFEIQKSKLIKAIESGAKYVDIEIEVPEEKCSEIIECAKKHNCKLIISYHNFIETPGLRELFNIVDECYKRGADVAKIATLVNKTEDNARLMALYSVGKPIVSIGMGEIGKVSRIIAPLMGAEFTFAAQDDGAATAPGQIKYSDMKYLIEQINKMSK